VVPVRIVAPLGAEGSPRLEFFATESEGKYSAEHVYQVQPRQGAPKFRSMKERLAPVLSGLPPVESAQATTRVGENRIYFIASPEKDFFFHEIVFNQRPPVSIPLSVDSLPGPARLRGDLVGMTEAPEVPRDHHVRIRLNGSQVYEGFFKGTESHRFDVPLPEGLLLDHNEVQIEAVADAGSDVDVFLVNWIEVEAPRALRASGDRLEFASGARGPFRLRGFTSPDIRILDVTHPLDPVSLNRFSLKSESDGTFSVLFQETAAPAGVHRYHAAARPAIAAPSLRIPPSERDLREKSNRGEYLVVTVPAFHEALEPLLEMRRSEGLDTRVVDVEAVYDQFGHGGKSPEAIRDFLKAAGSWNRPPRFLLLAGGASFDPRGYLGTPWSDMVPTKLFVTSKYRYEAADDGFFASRQPVSVGRLPAQTPEEMASAVAKIVEFETLQADRPLGRALFVADDRNARSGLDDPSFEQTSELLASGLSDLPVAIRRLYLGQSENPREEMASAVGEGTDLINFLGHGGPQIWTSQGILMSGDAPQLPNGPGSYFMVFSMTCFDGAFTYPYGDSLAWSLVKAPGRGAVAAFSPSTLLDPGPHARLDRLLLEGAFREGPVRLGDLVRAAERSLPADQAAIRDMVNAFNLIGDPAMRLKRSER
jgi:hypothetical protein